MNLIWTLLAKKSFNKNIEYLEENWTVNTVQNFILEVEKVMEILIENSNCFQEWEFDTSFRKGHIDKHISFFYKIHDKEIVVYLFWNNFQNPKKIKQKLLKS